MGNKSVFVLFVIIIFVFLFKFPLGEKFEDFLCNLKIEKLCSFSHKFSLFLGVFLFPFLLSLLFLYCFRKYKNSYKNVSRKSLRILIIIALFFSFHGLFGVMPELAKHVPIFWGLLGVIILSEGYFSVSLILLFITLFFFAFGKKNIPKESNL